MPPVIAAIAATVEAIETTVAVSLISAGVSTTVALAIAGATPGLLLGAAAIGAELLLDRPPKPAAQQNPIKTEIPPRVSGYGRAKLSGAYMLFESPNASWLGVLAVHDGLIDGVERYFFHDDEIDVTNDDAGAGLAGGVVNPGPTYPKGDKYFQRGHGPNGRFDVSLGTTPGPGFPLLNSYAAGYAPSIWDSNHRGDGIAAFYVGAAEVGPTHQQAVWPNGIPNASASLRLLQVFDPRLNGTESLGPFQPGYSSYYPTPGLGWQWSSNPVLALLHFLCVHPAGPQIDYVSKIAPNVEDWIHAANVCDERVVRRYGQAHITSQPWVSIGDHLCSLADGANGILQGDIATLTPGQVITFGGETMTVSSLGAGVGAPTGVHGWIVNFTSAFTLNHATNEPVVWQPPFGAITEPRYAIGGAFSWDTDPIDTIKQMLLVMDGWLATKADGTITVAAGEFVAPDPVDDLLTDPHILDYEVQHFLPDEEAVNEFKPTYTEADRKFAENDAGAIQDEANITAIGKRRSQPLQMPWCPSGSQARRVAKARMKRNTGELRGWVRTNMWGMNQLGKRFVNLQISDNAALHSLTVEITKVDIDLASLSLVFQWIAVDGPNLYGDWNPTTDEVPLFASLGGGSPFQGLAAPTITSPAVNATQVTGNGVGSTLTLTVSNPPGDLGTAGNTTGIVVRTAPAGSGNWTYQTLQDVTLGSGTTTITTGIVPAGNTDVQVAYQTAAGISDWSSTTTINAAQQASGTPVMILASENITVTAGVPMLVNVWNNGGTTEVRHADKTLAQQAHGFIIATVAMGAQATVYFDGLVTGLSGLTGGDVWLGASGVFTSTAPAASETAQVVGTAVSATEVDFNPKAANFPT